MALTKFKFYEYEDKIEFRPTFWGWLFRNRVIVSMNAMAKGFVSVDDSSDKVVFRKK